MGRRRTSPAVRAAMVGAGLAVVVLSATAVGSWWYLRSSGSLAKVESPDRVVFVFSSRAQDGAQVAQVIAVVSADGGSVRYVAPETSATVPGTTYGTLRDAYPFGGASAVAKAAAGQGADIGWVDVPEAVWTSAVDDVRGMKVGLPSSMEVFDGRRLVSFRAGEQTVQGRDVGPLLNGSAFLDGPDREMIRRQVGAGSLRAFVLLGLAPVEGAATNLSDAAYGRVAKGVLGP